MIENILPHLHYFWLVAKERGFTPAARRARVSQSAVSHQIKLLEEKLGVPLFLRGARGKIALTGEGNQLFHRCEEIFQTAQAGLDELKGLPIAGRLSITAPIQFGSHFLVPFLPQFLSKYPQLKIEVHISDAVEDFRQGRIDVALRWRAKPHPDLVMEPLVEERYRLVASPGYLAKGPPLKRCEDLKNHRMLIYGTHWIPALDFNDPVFEKSFSLADKMMISSVPAMLNGAIHGLGIAALPSHVAMQAIHDKKLVSVLPKLQFPCESFFFVCPKRLYDTPKLTAFRNLFRSYLQKKFKGGKFCKCR